MAEIVGDAGAAQAQDQHPLLAARPPVTDPITYLTIVEYNLSEETLPVLHQVLQDPELTANIGWDLIHLLLPLLPASHECLQDIATRGNPRECVLKVTEALRLLDFGAPDLTTTDDEGEIDDKDDKETQLKVPEIEVGESSTSPAFPRPIPPPLPVLKFEVLLDLLATLHRRIKTKYPSRFLSTSLQAVLVAFNRATSHYEELTLAAIKLVKTLSGTKRPHLPSRRSSNANLLTRTNTGQSQPDPEEQAEAPTDAEQTLVNRLLQSFITHVLEDYVLSLTSDDDVPGLSWASRLMEKYEPQRIPRKPEYIKYADRFAEDEDLMSRTAILGQAVALTQDLGLEMHELLRTIMDTETEKRGAPGSEDEPPASAEEIPLSRTGALILLTAQSVKQELYAAVKDQTPEIPVFPGHAVILQNFVGVLGPQTVGLEPEALIDTILALGLIAVAQNNVGEPVDDEAFATYLQTVSLISANTPSASLRGHAHYLTTTILRSHPHDLVRLTFIRDTLEHCPYENLKASAVSWLKGETLEANPPSASASPSPAASDDGTEAGPPSIFSTPIALSTVSPHLFPDLTSTLPPPPSANLAETYTQFRLDTSFYVASLNFYYLLLRAPHLHDPLAVGSLNLESFLDPLKDGTRVFKDEIENGTLNNVLGEGNVEKSEALAELGLVERVLGWVEGARVAAAAADGTSGAGGRA